jgi:UDP-N-acetylenolpyruvoylglucosamine reductase
LDVFPLGGGSNVLVPENRIDGVVVRMNAKCWDFCTFGAKTIAPNTSEEAIINFLEAPISGTVGETSEALYVHVGCGTGMKTFLDAAEARRVGGFEFLDGIPGTVGGALSMNAGTDGQGILGVAEQVVWIDADGTVRVTAHSELKYGYRYCETFQNGVIVSALLKGFPSTTEDIRQKRAELRKKRVQSQPKGKTLGCFFKNPQSCSAGQLLEQCGAKGKRVGEIFVSEQHANFIINNGNGRFDDAVRLVKSLRTMVHERSGVWLEPEVRILGKSWDEFL